MRVRKPVGVAAAAIAASLLAMGGFALWLAADRPAMLQAAIGGPFDLTDQHGRRRTDAEFRGRLMLVSFGFTFCPDVCPLTLQAMSETLAALGSDARRVQPLFVSVDPPRDTPARLKEYVGHFSPDILGLTGSEEDVARVARAYRVYYKAQGSLPTDPNYTVDHTATIYLMDGEGRFVTHFAHDAPPDRIVAAIRRLL